MKWESDQRNGWFGWSDGQALHMAVVDVHQAIAESRELMQMFQTTQQHPGAQPFTGGVLDSWPAYAVDGLAVAKLELERIRRHVQEEKHV